MNKTMPQKVKIFAILILVVILACNNGANDRNAQLLNYPLTQQTGDVVFGDELAPASVFMYASYHCNYCRYFFSRTFPEFKTNYLDKGKVKLVVKWVDFQDNPQVLRALQAASCISRFGTYEKYHELLLVNPDVVFSEDFAVLVDDIMNDNSEIAECILSDPDFGYLRSNVKEFRENNLSGTPTFILNNKIYSGFLSYDNFVKLLNKEFEL